MSARCSIIVPVYNAAKYIRQCIESIIYQDYEDWELLLIDDGSNDESGVICDEYALRDNRIKVKHVNNGGASKARNLGLDIATGEYVWFIDADDWIENNSLSQLLIKVKTDIVFFGFKRIFSDGQISVCQIQPKGSDYYNDKYTTAIDDLFLSSEAYFGYSWNKLFKRDIIEKYRIRFNENLIIKEDEVFTFEYIRRISSLTISCATPYNYRILDNSVSHSLKSKRNMFQLAEYMRHYILDDSYYAFMRQSICQAIYLYYWEAVIEESRTTKSIDSINGFLSYIREHKAHIKFRGKQKVFSFLPTDILKRNFIKIYLKLYDIARN